MKKKLDLSTVTTLEAVYAIAKPTSEEQSLFDYKGESKGMIAAQGILQLDMINKVLNDGVVMDFMDRNQWKYFGYFWVVKDDSKATGFGLSLDGVDYTDTSADVGARLCFVDEKTFRHAFKYFPEIFEKVLIVYK